jgi:hypothetical protein
MRHRPTLALLATLALLLVGCGPPHADAMVPASAGPPAADALAPAPGAADAPSPRPARGTCPTTRPPRPRFVPPAPYPPRPPASAGARLWYGTDDLWTWLDADGTWEMAHDRHGLFDKSFWWRRGYDWRTETSPRLWLTGRRLDGPAPAVTVSDATNGYEASMGAFMLVGLEVPTAGCWELTGHYHGRSLRLVVRVTRWRP